MEERKDKRYRERCCSCISNRDDATHLQRGKTLYLVPGPEILLDPAVGTVFTWNLLVEQTLKVGY